MPENQIEEWDRLHRFGYQRQLLGEWESAKRYYEQALVLKPDYAFAQLALTQLRMMQTCFREGRELYETRFAARDDQGGFDWRQLPTPRWHGESLKGKHLHLWVEQGFGDVIMYAGFLRWFLAQQPSRITLSMFPKMMTLFARSFPQIAIESLQDIGHYALSPAILDTFPQLLKLAQQTGMEDDLEPMRRDYERVRQRGKPDYAAPMGDLMVHGLPDFVPAQRQAAYLTAEPERMVETRKHLQQSGAGRLVGISWHTPNVESGSVRNIPLEQWIPILSVSGCHFIALQHNVLPLEIKNFCTENRYNITVPQFDVVQDTEGLVTLTAAMDEVITIDNSNAHLAGALGVPTTLLLPKGCDFRWPVLQDGVDTLWYSSVKVERQETPMDWFPVIQRVAGRLRRRIA